MLKVFKEPVILEITDEHIAAKDLRLFIKREDLLHPAVSGNKWRKLRYNLQEARELGHDTLLTFGGAFSNHIYATAAAARETGFRAIGIIRGEEHLPLNPTLSFATEQGMQLAYMDRTTYRRKQDQDVMDELKRKFGHFYLIPEGGTNSLAVKGCEEMVNAEVRQFDYVCLPVGTGGTIAGVICGMQGMGQVIGFSVLKGDFLTTEVNNLLHDYLENPPSNWQVNSDYHFGGYAKVKPELLAFIDTFYKKHHLQLDPIYTGKMMYGVYELIDRNKFPAGSKILAIHTGGLQGNKGMVLRTLRL